MAVALNLGVKFPLCIPDYLLYIDTNDLRMLKRTRRKFADTVQVLGQVKSMPAWLGDRLFSRQQIILNRSSRHSLSSPPSPWQTCPTTRSDGRLTQHPGCGNHPSRRLDSHYRPRHAGEERLSTVESKVLIEDFIQRILSGPLATKMPYGTQIVRPAECADLRPLPRPGERCP